MAFGPLKAYVLDHPNCTETLRDWRGPDAIYLPRTHHLGYQAGTEVQAKTARGKSLNLSIFLRNSLALGGRLGKQGSVNTQVRSPANQHPSNHGRGAFDSSPSLPLGRSDI